MDWSCGWRWRISSYLFMPSLKLWRGSMMLQLQILYAFSSAPTYLLDVTRWAICTEEDKGRSTQLTDLLLLCRYGDPEESLDVQEEVITAARRYMVSLYDRSDFGGTVDALRAPLFVSIKGKMRCLPPTEDAFLSHLRRALHQLAVCKRAHMVQPT